MRKYGLLLLIPFLLQCKSAEKLNPSCYQGKLVLQGICMNYVIEAVNKDLDTNKVEPIWQNPMSGKVYSNIFALASVCTFPANIKEGDTFYFKVLNTPPKDNNCAQCLAYSPTPNKKLYIEVCP